jgi:ABC-2 type transport system permease protein
MTSAPSPIGDRARAFWAMCLARFREFYREPEVIFWVFLFPILLSVGLGIAFRNRPAEKVAVAVVSGEQAARILDTLRAAPLVDVVARDAAGAAHDLRMGRVAVVVSGQQDGSVRYDFDPGRPESVLARARVDDVLQRAAGRQDPLPSQDRHVSEPGARYIDFLIPGLIGLNLMSGGMWGVGFHIVDMRIKKLLKRLIATPMRRADFMAAQMAIRLFSMIFEVVLLLVFGRIVFDLPVRGSWGSVLLIGAIGALAFGGMGLLVASRVTRIEAVSGLMNLVTMPMFVFSGVFFSAERFPPYLQPAIQALPLTALNDAMRAVVLEGASLVSQSGELAILVGWGGLSFALGLRLFRWS